MLQKLLTTYHINPDIIDIVTHDQQHHTLTELLLSYDDNNSQHQQIISDILSQVKMELTGQHIIDNVDVD
jgi:hypothetical protein